MLDLAKCEIIDSRSLPLLSTVLTLEEGVAMVYDMENGKGVIKPSTGASGEIFAGVSQMKHVTPSQANIVVETLIPASGPYTVTLAKTPVNAASVNVYIAGVAATQGTVADNVYSVSGNVLTFHSADAGLAIKVLYRYALTAAEAAMIYGGEIIGQTVQDEVNVTTISTGTIFTDSFVIADTWEAGAGPVYLGESGKFTLQSGGTALDAVIVGAPSVSNGMLGLSLKP